MTTPDVETEWDDFVIDRDSTEGRFGITVVDADIESTRFVTEMPFGELRDPNTSMPSLGLLTILVDGAGGSANYLNFRGRLWSVTSELSLDLAGEAGTAFGPGSAGTIRCEAHTIHADAASAIALCGLTIDGAQIGTGTVRTYGITAQGDRIERIPDTLGGADRGSLFPMLALTPYPGAGDEVYALAAGHDLTLHNSMGLMHGGAVSASLEVVAAGAISRAAPEVAMSTGSIRVNYMRPMLVGPQARYEGEVVRVGRNVAVAESRAIGGDGKVAAIARVTSYAVAGR